MPYNQSEEQVGSPSRPRPPARPLGLFEVNRQKHLTFTLYFKMSRFSISNVNYTKNICPFLSMPFSILLATYSKWAQRRRVTMKEESDVSMSEPKQCEGRRPQE